MPFVVEVSETSDGGGAVGLLETSQVEKSIREHSNRGTMDEVEGKGMATKIWEGLVADRDIG